MSKLLSRVTFGLCVAFVLGACAIGHAALIPSYAPFLPGTTDAYGTGPGDYQSRADVYGTPVNDLLGAVTAQGSGTTGLGPTRTGLGELITPQTGSTYGSPNDSALTVNTLTLPVSGGTGTPDIILKITPGQLLDSANGNAPLPPTSGLSTAVWTPGASVYENTFSFNPGANAYMMTLDLLGAFTADPVNNPAPPSLALDQTYLVSFEWDLPGVDPDNTPNSFVMYRMFQVDPGGQIMIKLRQDREFATFAAAPFSSQAPRGAALAINVPPVPEPSSLILIGLALPALFVARRKLRG